MQSAKFKRILGAGLQQVLLITVAVSQIGVSLANAQGNSAAREQLLAASEALTVDAILEAALVNAPAARSEVSLRAMSEAFDALGNSWVASRPSLQISVYDDSPLDNIGLQEFETGVSFNLWRPGERSDTAALGDQHQTRLEAWREHLQLLVAGQVRAVLGELAAAERRLEIAQQASADAERLLATTVDMEAVGAAAQSDVLQARTQSLQQQ